MCGKNIFLFISFNSIEKFYSKYLLKNILFQVCIVCTLLQRESLSIGMHGSDATLKLSTDTINGYYYDIWTGIIESLRSCIGQYTLKMHTLHQNTLLQFNARRYSQGTAKNVFRRGIMLFCIECNESFIVYRGFSDGRLGGVA